jgi:hypothetical protein
LSIRGRLSRLEGAASSGYRRCTHCGSVPRIAVLEGGEWVNGPPCERWPHPECDELGAVVIKVVYEDAEEDDEGLSWP